VFSFLVFWVGVFLLPLLSGFIFQSNSAVGVAGRSGGGHRLDIWWQMLLAIQSEFLWGYGWSQAGIAQYLNPVAGEVSVFVMSGHNIFLDIIIYCGAIIGLPMVFFACFWFFSRLFSVKCADAWVLMSMISFVFLHALLELPLNYAFFLLSMAMFAGMVDFSYRETGFFYMPSLLVSSFFAVLSLVGIAIYCEYRALEDRYRTLRHDAFSFRENDASAPRVVLLTQLDAYVSAVAFNADLVMGVDAIERAKALAYRFPYLDFLRNYCHVLILNGEYDKAREELLRIRSLHGDAAYAQMVVQLSRRLSGDGAFFSFP
jgi:hypothetical protein